jgi:pimeloyl-ACP methyl ester carboxylesterase
MTLARAATRIEETTAHSTGGLVLDGPIRRSCAGSAGKVSYLEWGGRPGATPLLFLHPVNTAAEIWVDLMDQLDRPAVAVDYRGHGRSDHRGPFLPTDFAADAFAALDDAGLPRAVLVGGSIGGAVSVEMAHRSPEKVAGIALFGAGLRFGIDTETLHALTTAMTELGPAEWFRSMSGDILGPDAPTDVPARIAQLAGGRPAELIAEILQGTFCDADSRPAADTVRSAGPPPALVATGSHDPTCPPAMAEELAGYLACTAVVMDRLGHLPMLEAPKETAALLGAFLDSVDAHRREGI